MSILDRDNVNAFCRHTHVEVEGVSNGPLAELTFGLKDIYDIAGHKTGFGSPDWLATHAPATATASVATRLLEAGANMVGKTHTEEMAFSLTGENAHYGTPTNPAAPSRVPGGSSSGSAAAVAGRLVDFAIGSDTGGSVRAPASFCGIYGIRPTYGRIPLDGVCPLAPGFDTCGWFARSAEMLSRVGDVLLGGIASSPGRLIIAVDAFECANSHTAAALLPAVAKMGELFGEADEVRLSSDGLSSWYEVFRILQFGEIWEAHGEWVRQHKPTFGSQIKPRFEAAAKIESAAVEQMKSAQKEIRHRLDTLLADNAVLLLPTMPDIAPLLRLPSEETIAFRERALALLCIAGLGGLPQVSIPAAKVNRYPLGLSIVAARGNDEMLLEVARVYSREAGQDSEIAGTAST